MSVRTLSKTPTKNNVANHVLVDHLTVTFERRGQEQLLAVDNISLNVKPGEFVSLLGPSGCGKSTIFSVIAGLIEPAEGKVFVEGSETTGFAGAVGYMLQKDMLLPWRTIQDNICLGLEFAGLKRREARKIAHPIIAKCGLSGFESSYPAQLSGGMRQRAAFARTILHGRQVIMLDEPFSALDAQTRSNLHDWLEDLTQDLKSTFILITHDVEEAVRLSDRIYVMSPRPGRILDVISVDLPRPRGKNCTTTPQFSNYKAQALRLLGHDTADNYQHPSQTERYSVDLLQGSRS